MFATQASVYAVELAVPGSYPQRTVSFKYRLLPAQSYAAGMFVTQTTDPGRPGRSGTLTTHADVPVDLPFLGVGRQRQQPVPVCTGGDAGQHPKTEDRAAAEVQCGTEGVVIFHANIEGAPKLSSLSKYSCVARRCLAQKAALCAPQQDPACIRLRAELVSSARVFGPPDMALCSFPLDEAGEQRRKHGDQYTPEGHRRRLGSSMGGPGGHISVSKEWSPRPD